MYNVAVIGAGVIGLTTAVKIQERFGTTVSVTIFTENVSPNTTGDISAGLWTPYLMQDTPEEKITQWSKLTSDYFEHLWKSGYAQEAGISLLPTYGLSSKEVIPVPSWWKVPFGFTKLPEKYLQKLNREHKQNYIDGVMYITFTCEPTKFLPFVQNIFIKNGGRLKLSKITNFEALSDFDVIVNCTGLYSQKLVNDALVKPIRGQITRIKAPWQNYALVNDNNYIIPNIDSIILGGTKQIDDYNLEVVDLDKEHILDGCYKISPSLKEAPVIKHMVGLRPGRSEVRLELETEEIGNKQLKIVHNYGHGGCGVTLCVGCAVDATKLVEVALNLNKSKL